MIIHFIRTKPKVRIKKGLEVTKLALNPDYNTENIYNKTKNPSKQINFFSERNDGVVISEQFQRLFKSFAFIHEKVADPIFEKQNKKNLSYKSKILKKNFKSVNRNCFFCSKSFHSTCKKNYFVIHLTRDYLQKQKFKKKQIEHRRFRSLSDTKAQPESNPSNQQKNSTILNANGFDTNQNDKETFLIPIKLDFDEVYKQQLRLYLPQYLNIPTNILASTNIDNSSDSNCTLNETDKQNDFRNFTPNDSAEMFDINVNHDSHGISENLNFYTQLNDIEYKTVQLCSFCVNQAYLSVQNEFCLLAYQNSNEFIANNPLQNYLIDYLNNVLNADMTTVFLPIFYVPQNLYFIPPLVVVQPSIPENYLYD